MYIVKIISNFSSAHSLRNYKGKCEAIHGHNWKIEVLASSNMLNSSGMVIDFSDLKKITKDVLEELDHKYLNDLDYFSAKGDSASGEKGHNPSSEEIAKYIFTKIKNNITLDNGKLKEVRVWETENSCAKYYED